MTNKTFLSRMPLSLLISNPSNAAVDAYKQISNTTIEYINTVGMEEKQGKLTARKLSIYRKNKRHFYSTSSRYEIPILTLTGIPHLSIKTLSFNVSCDISKRVLSKKDENLNFKTLPKSVKTYIRSNRNTNKKENRQLSFFITMNINKNTLGCKKLKEVANNAITLRRQI